LVDASVLFTDPEQSEEASPVDVLLEQERGAGVAQVVEGDLR
jgi:hypothetical protein